VDLDPAGRRALVLVISPPPAPTRLFLPGPAAVSRPNGAPEHCIGGLRIVQPRWAGPAPVHFESQMGRQQRDRQDENMASSSASLKCCCRTPRQGRLEGPGCRRETKRSIRSQRLLLRLLHRFRYRIPAATCQSGYGAVCKADRFSFVFNGHSEQSSKFEIQPLSNQ
jgi:hypothetical protein